MHLTMHKSSDDDDESSVGTLVYLCIYTYVLQLTIELCSLGKKIGFDV